jgi:uncharacterized membrane protein YheB (UPF0754 family)
MTNSTPTAEDVSKDRFFERVAALAQEMIDAHGREFTMGTLVLAARGRQADRTPRGTASLTIQLSHFGTHLKRLSQNKS